MRCSLPLAIPRPITNSLLATRLETTTATRWGVPGLPLILRIISRDGASWDGSLQANLHDLWDFFSPPHKHRQEPRDAKEAGYSRHGLLLNSSWMSTENNNVPRSSRVVGGL